MEERGVLTQPAGGKSGGGFPRQAPTPFKTGVKFLDRPRQSWHFGAMAKIRSSYVCQNCGAITQRWQGKCEACGEWNTIIEEAAALGVGGAAARRGAAGRPFPLEDLAGVSKPEPGSSRGSPSLTGSRAAASCPVQRR